MLMKMQGPLYSNTGNHNEVLCYNKDRTVESILQMEKKEIDSLFSQDEYKVFWKGYIIKEGQFVALEKIPEENWPSW